MGAKSVKRRVGYRREALHEDLARGGVPQGGSDRAFGVVFALIFAGLGTWFAASGRGAWPVAAYALAATFGLAAWLAPRRLAPLNRLWTRFGLMIHAVVSPLVLALLFYGVITPTGLIMRALGKDPLGLAYDREAKSYWIKRQPPAPDTMRNQF